MSYKVKAVRIFSKGGGNTGLEDYEKEVASYSEALKEKNRLKSLCEYVNIVIQEIKNPT